MKNKLSMLTDPPAVVKSGPVTATLTWNLDQSDVDLHIYEPSGTHIYYGLMAGTSGGLDVDNTEGVGPEHYYTECNQLQTGEYRFGLNYFADHLQRDANTPSRTVTASVIVSVPGASTIIHRVLNGANFSAGNHNPVLVAKVIVEKIDDPSNPNRNGLLKYRIEEQQGT